MTLNKKKQIYIVDDDESVCRSLKILLDALGFEVRAFSSAEEFIRGYETLSDELSYKRVVSRALKVVSDHYSVEAFESCLSDVVDQIKANRNLASSK